MLKHQVVITSSDKIRGCKNVHGLSEPVRVYANQKHPEYKKCKDKQKWQCNWHVINIFDIN